MLPCFVIAVITADQDSGTWVEDCGIQECLVTTPGERNLGPVTLLQAGRTIGIAPASTNER